MKDNKVLKIVCISLLSIIALVYFYIMVFNANIDTEPIVDTEYAARYTYDEKLTVKGMVIREETLLDFNTDKILYYTVEDGSIVRADTDVALIFDNEEDALGYKRINKIDEEISMLEGLNTSYENVNTDFEAAEKQIVLNVRELISSVNSNDCITLSSDIRELTYSINQRQIITGEVKDFNSIIKSLKDERTDILNSCGTYSDTTLKASKPGYFVSFADGYENVFDYKNVANMTLSDFDNMPQRQDVSENTVGKIISGLNWYIACRLTAEDALMLSPLISSHEATILNLSFPDSSCKDIPATLVSINQTSKQSDAIAIFSCNYMNSPLSHLRSETVEISINTYSGLRISKDSIHDDIVKDIDTGKDVKVQGVYVLRGSELVFKEISIVYSGSDFVIIDPNPKEGVLRSGQTVALNDSVVVRGDNLYNGKNVK